MLAICTMFDKKFMAEGWLCLQSIFERIPSLRVYLLCLDDAVLEKARTWPVAPIPLFALERVYPQLLKVKAERQWPPYTQTCKVFLPSFAFASMSENDVLVYVDSDMLFWGDPRSIEGELGEASFMVTSRESPVRPAQGPFNGGFFACRKDERAKAFLEWWQAKTIEWCEWQPGPDGKFGEEGYLSVIEDEPDKFPGTKVCQHPGINLARWNVAKHKIELAGEGVIIDEEWPLICYHYQAFDPQGEHYGLGGRPTGPVTYLYKSYADRLAEMEV